MTSAQHRNYSTTVNCIKVELNFLYDYVPKAGHGEKINELAPVIRNG